MIAVRERGKERKSTFPSKRGGKRTADEKRKRREFQVEKREGGGNLKEERGREVAGDLLAALSKESGLTGEKGKKRRGKDYDSLPILISTKRPVVCPAALSPAEKRKGEREKDRQASEEGARALALCGHKNEERD